MRIPEPGVIELAQDGDYTVDDVGLVRELLQYQRPVHRGVGAVALLAPTETLARLMDFVRHGVRKPGAGRVLTSRQMSSDTAR